jgi:hypothetical protein
VNGVLCEGCGRAGGEQEVFCPACGRPLPGRVAAPSEATPPGWLLASGRGSAASFFEPLPAVAVVQADPLAPARASRGWNVRVNARAEVTPDTDTAVVAAGAADPEPKAAAASAEPEAALDAARPRLRVLYIPLLALIVLSSAAAVLLVVLHLLREG